MQCCPASVAKRRHALACDASPYGPTHFHRHETPRCISYVTRRVSEGRTRHRTRQATNCLPRPSITPLLPLTPGPLSPKEVVQFLSSTFAWVYGISLQVVQP